MAATLPKSKEELTQTGRSLISGVADYMNGSSARKVGLRYLFGDIMVMGSAAIMGNWSKLSSGLVAVFQSIGFFADGEKNKTKILNQVTNDIDDVLNKASAALAGSAKIGEFDKQAEKAAHDAGIVAETREGQLGIMAQKTAEMLQAKNAYQALDDSGRGSLIQSATDYVARHTVMNGEEKDYFLQHLQENLRVAPVQSMQ